MNHGYAYQAAPAASEGAHRRVEGIFGGDRRLDFSRPFMPESPARVELFAFLPAEEKTVLNQIRGNAYLCIFGLVEEFTLPFVPDHARPVLREDVRNGYEDLRVVFRVKADAPEEKIREPCEIAQRRSAVFDIVSNPVTVPVSVEKA